MADMQIKNDLENRTGEAAGFSSRNATVLSIMGWAVGLTVGIAAICALIDNETGSTTFH